ncbi:MAG: PDZ domain-containing protein [Pyrinomonadaceae bacterium]
MNCKNYQAELDEIIGEKMLPTAILNHLSNCPTCQTFKVEREKLTLMLQDLQAVNSPADFNFRVKARIRQQETNVTIKTWRKFALLVPTALAVLIIGFVLVKTFVLQPPAPQNAGVVFPSQIETSQAATQSPTPENPALIENTSPGQSNEFAEKPLKEREIAFKPSPKPRFARAASRRVLATTSSSLKDEPKEIHSRDTTGGGAPPSVYPAGIQNPLDPNRKQNGKDLLQTLGVEIAVEGEALRVVSVKENSQGAKAGLEAGDVVEKINGENPQEVSGSKFTELNLTARRKDQKQEIKIIIAKP